MSIEITIVRTPQDVQNTRVSHIFNEQGGTIGRGVDNAWVIEDPERFISSTHTQISFENGQYYLQDLSTNGTFMNGASEPVGNGNRVPLKDGDRFNLSEYEFLVSMQAGNADPVFGASDPYAADPFAAAPVADPFAGGMANQSDPFATPFAGGAANYEPIIASDYEEKDPLAALEKANRSQTPDPFSINSTPFNSAPLSASAPVGGLPGDFQSQPDNADSMHQAIAWPSAIPENWDDDHDHDMDMAAPMPSAPIPAVAPLPGVPSVDPDIYEKLLDSERKRERLEVENERLLNEVMQLQQRLKNAQAQPQPQTVPTPASRRATRSHSAADVTLVEAMGLGNRKISLEKQQEISAVVGELIRETMVGLMQALSFRKKIKEEFRINVTTIQPVENNPLKFSANLEDALENMFVKDNKAYQQPLDAVRESFQGISEHQVAVLAGIQAAFRGMIERLDPEALEKRFEKYRKTGVIKVGTKGKNWDAYKEFHQDLVNNIDNSFQHLFGYDFVQAYEDQLQRLLMMRKTRNNANN